MKIIFKSLTILLTLCFFTACDDDSMISVNPDFILSFERDGQTTALAGTTFYVIKKGSGEFLTLFDGSLGKVYNPDELAKGNDFDKLDSLPVKYNAAGKYKLTVLSTSTSEMGKKVTRSVKTVEVNVIDERNNLVEFRLPIGAAGKFVKGVFSNDSIFFLLPHTTSSFNFVPSFKLGSPASALYIGDVLQTSLVSSTDFSNPITYTVKSLNDIDMGLPGKNYVVAVKLFEASSEKKITKFNFSNISAHGEVGVIDEINKTINITANYATDVTTITKLLVNSSYASVVFLRRKETPDFAELQTDARSKYNLVANDTVRVQAQDGSQVDYTVIITQDHAVNSFTFAGLVPEPIGLIDYTDSIKTITFNVLPNTDVTKLTAKWTGSTDMVKVGDVPQKNGVTINDFSTPVSYIFYKGAVAGETYLVIVNKN